MILRKIGSGSLRSGAGRPENRVTARSKLPQKKCTGLDLPIKRDLKTLKTSSTETRVRQKRRAYSLSYDAWVLSWSNGIGLAISTGMCQIVTSIFNARSADINSW